MSQRPNEPVALAERVADRPGTVIPEDRPSNVRVAARPAREPKSYPENVVEYVETASRCLTYAYEQHRLLDDLQAHLDLLERLQMAVAECQLRLSVLGPRVANARRK